MGYEVQTFSTMGKSTAADAIARHYSHSNKMSFRHRNYFKKVDKRSNNEITIQCLDRTPPETPEQTVSEESSCESVKENHFQDLLPVTHLNKDFNMHRELNSLESNPNKSKMKFSA